MSAAPLVSFFMIVTDRDCVIADYAVNSYSRIRNLPFRLVIYSNWVLSELRERYFTRWRRLPFVRILDDPERTDDRKPRDPGLWGPFELGYAIWDRELRRLGDTPFHAVVDADFEILDPCFILPMLERLSGDDGLAAVSTDSSPTTAGRYDTYTGQVIELVERWHTHFCIYKREVLRCEASYRARVEISADGTHRRVWDDHAYFQQKLREDHGYRLAALNEEFKRCYVHYGAFGHNRHITERNVAFYRSVQILRRHGLLRRGDRLSRSIGRALDRTFFRAVDRGTYAPGWGMREYAEVVKK